MGERSYKLIYYDIRGLAEPIRWMFRLANVDFEDIRIPLDNWESEREKFSKHVGKLPILICIGGRDRNVELTQANAILRYMAKQLGFDGESELEQTRVDEVVELLDDLRLCAIDQKNLFTSKTPDIVRHTVFRDFQREENLSKKVLMKKHLINEDIPKYLHKISMLLQQSGGPFFAGDKLTYADLAFANFIDILEGTINPDLLDEYPDLQNLVEEIFEMPELKEWMELTQKFSTDNPAPEASVGA